MKAQIACFGLALMLCALRVGRAQEPKPEDILKRAVGVYQGLNSYQDSATLKMQMKMMGMDMAFELSGGLALVKPNKMSMSLKMNAMGMSNDFSVTSDGKKMWQYMSANKEYTEKDAPATLSDALKVAGQPGGFMGEGPGMMLFALILDDEARKSLTQDIKNLKLAGSEEIDGKPVYVLTWDAAPPDAGKGEAPMPMPADLKDLALPVKAWISKDDGLILQMSMDVGPMFKAIFSMFAELGSNLGEALGGEKKPQADKQQLEQFKAALKDLQMMLTETHKDVKINAPIPDETFTFKPPADAKKVDQLDMSAMQKAFDLPFPGMGDKKEAQPVSPLVGKPAPDFALKDRTGKIVKLSQFRGKPVLLNFWAEF